MALLFQTTDFTCGPVCLKMAMHRLDPARPIREVNEFLIWREANSVFMGHGHAGCTPYGLARSALRRGFTASIISNNMPAADAALADNVLKENERRIYALVHDHDQFSALKEGAVPESRPYNEFLLEDILSEGKVPIMLVKSFGDQDEHWIMVDKVQEGIITVLDPYEKHAVHASALTASSDEEATHALTFEELSNYCLHGREQVYLILAIGRKQSIK